MQKLYQIMVPGLAVSSDWRLIHDRLLDEFSEVRDVLPTAMKGTILTSTRDRPTPVLDDARQQRQWKRSRVNSAPCSG
jgi:hypothetical protein